MVKFAIIAKTWHWESEVTGGSKLDVSHKVCYKSSHWKPRKDKQWKQSQAQEREVPSTCADPPHPCSWGRRCWQVIAPFPMGTKNNFRKLLTLSLPAAIASWSETLEKTFIGHLWSVTLKNILRCFSHRCPQIRIQCLDSFVWLVLYYKLWDWVPQWRDCHHQ